MLFRLLYLLPLLLFSCILAGVYGALHNQISYTVSPGYFHEFKFVQFQIDPELQSRQGASLVGAFASWWMGVVIGIPIYLTSLFVKEDSDFWKVFLKAASLVVGITLIVGLGALAVSFVTVRPDALPWWMEGRSVTDPVRFARAGTMHNFSYIGGLAGLVCGLGYVILAAWRSHRDAAQSS